MSDYKNLYALVVFEGGLPVEDSLILSESKADILRTYDISRTAAKLSRHSTSDLDGERYAKIFVNHYLLENDENDFIADTARVCMSSNKWNNFGWKILVSGYANDEVLDETTESITNEEIAILNEFERTLSGMSGFRQSVIVSNLIGRLPGVSPQDW